MASEMIKLLKRLFCRRTLLWFSFSGLIAGLCIYCCQDLYLRRTGLRISFSLKYDNQKNNHWQIFYWDGEHKDIIITPPVYIITAGKRQCTTTIPCQVLNRIRFDFGSHPKNVILENFKIQGMQQITLKDMKMSYINQITDMKIHESGLTCYSEGIDPYITLELKKPLQAGVHIGNYCIFWLVVIFSLIIAGLSAGIFFRCLEARRLGLESPPFCNFIKQYWFVGLCILALFIKYLLIQGIPLVARVYNMHDHAMMVNIADNIINGEWLGKTYINRYLAKGCAYPLLVAIQNLLGLSLRQMAWLFYSSGCLMMALALRPIVRYRLFLFLIFCFLLFFPNLEYEISLPYRSWIQFWLVLFIYSSLVAIFLRWKDVKAILSWSIPGILGSVIYWFSFENAFWIVILYLVSASVILGYSLWNKGKWSDSLLKFIIVLIPLGFVFLFHLIISSINYEKYGFFGTNVYADGNFPRMMKAIYSVKPSSDQYNLPVAVPQEVFHRIYSVSPTLARYKNNLGNAFSAFRGPSMRFPGGDEIETGWLYWAILSQFENMGFREQDEIFKLTAEEIEKAFRDGKLERRPVMPGTLIPPWRKDFLPAIIQVTPEFLQKCKNIPLFIILANCQNWVKRTDTTKQLPGIIKFSTVYRDIFWIDEKNTPFRIDLLNANVALVKLWLWWNPFFFYLAIFCLLGQLLLTCWSRKKEILYLSLIPLAVSGGIAVLLFGIIYTHISSFPAAGYLGPVLQLFQLLFMVTIPVFLFSLLSKDAFDLPGRMKKLEWEKLFRSSLFYCMLFILIPASAGVWAMSRYLDIKKPYLMKDRSPKMKINEIEICSLTDQTWQNGSHRNKKILLIANTELNRRLFKGKYYFSLDGNDQNIFKIATVPEKGKFLWLQYWGNRISLDDGKKHFVFVGYAP